MRRDLVLILLIAAAALGIRTYPAWNAVFNEAGVSFLETDAWYHVRLTENQVRNYPWRVTLDPFAAFGGQFVPIAPLFDTLTSTVIVLLHGRAPSTEHVERVAAMMPPLCGTLTVVAVWVLARKVFDRRAALLAAALLAVLPGHFMDRTMLGFVDHHALEALLAMAVMVAFANALSRNRPLNAALAGIALGLYLLAWGSGAFLIAIVIAWLLLYVLLAPSINDLRSAAAVSAVAAVIALVLVLVFQDSAMHRYGSQVLASVGLAAIALVIVAAARPRFGLSPWWTVVVSLMALAAIGVVFAMVTARDVVMQVLIDMRRFAPDPSRMGVLEARPLFLYSGNWNWAQPWTFFRTGFFIGALALIPFGVRVWRGRRAIDLLVWLFAVATFAATLGQNRFGYYLVTACALLGGWLAVEVLDWAGVPHADNKVPTPRTRLPLARELAVIAIAGGMFAPNLAPQVLLTERTASFPLYWRETMRWLRASTPNPFAPAGDDFYFARYAEHTRVEPAYAVMSWWDQGYWITQQARRVPVANPTQERASIAARFYTATDEPSARAVLDREHARYVVSDFELPFRRLGDGTIMGRFQTIADWAGVSHERYYEVAYQQEAGGWTPVWIFYEPYYRSMAFRLSVLGGGAATPTHATSVVTFATRVDSKGMRFREVVRRETFSTYEAARDAVARAPGDSAVVGLDPWQSAFPVEALESMVEVHASRTPEQKMSETPWVRVFEVR